MQHFFCEKRLLFRQLDHPAPSPQESGAVPEKHDPTALNIVVHQQIDRAQQRVDALQKRLEVDAIARVDEKLSPEEEYIQADTRFYVEKIKELVTAGKVETAKMVCARLYGYLLLQTSDAMEAAAKEYPGPWKDPVSGASFQLKVGGGHIDVYRVDEDPLGTRKEYEESLAIMKPLTDMKIHLQNGDRAEADRALQKLNTQFDLADATKTDSRNLQYLLQRTFDCNGQTYRLMADNGRLRLTEVSANTRRKNDIVKAARQSMIGLDFSNYEDVLQSIRGFEDAINLQQRFLDAFPQGRDVNDDGESRQYYLKSINEMGGMRECLMRRLQVLPRPGGGA